MGLLELLIIGLISFFGFTLAIDFIIWMLLTL